MSTNENIPASDERNVDTAPVATVVASDAPEPDITQAGRNLFIALLVLFIGIGFAAVFAANLFKINLSTATEARGGAVESSAAGQARAASAAHAIASGSVENSDGTTTHFVPVAQGAALLLASPDALAGKSQWLNVEGGDIATIPSLPTFAAVLDPAKAAEEAAAAAAEQAAAEKAAAEAPADDAEAAGEDAADGEPAAAE